MQIVSLRIWTAKAGKREYMKVIVWGCGDFGRRILPNLIQNGYEVAAYTDSDERLWGRKVVSFPVIRPVHILKKEFDVLMIAVSSPYAVKQIKEYVARLNVPSDKVVDIFTNVDFMDLFADQRTAFIKGYADWINSKGIEGNVAECGVFRGDSAKFINRYFPNRTLYLCDTFEGFADSDLQYEKGINNQKFNQSRFADQSFFSETGIDFVMSKMIYPKNIVLKKGYFPESMQEVQDRFCFVNLDMDLYIPMLNGLRFFWDRMICNGCILLHDYFLDVFTGVKQAVDTFESERGISIIKTPIGDECSVALFSY